MGNLVTKRREPYTFMLWMGIFSSLLVFSFLAVSYILLKNSPTWASFHLPGIFWLSTACVLSSSYTLHQANRAFHKEKFFAFRILIAATLVLGGSFITLQIAGWLSLIQANIVLSNSIAGAFLYILSGFHLLHIVIGLVLLSTILVQALRRLPYVESFVYSVNPPNQLRMNMITTYWHFIDVLWVGLFLFLLYHSA